MAQSSQTRGSDPVTDLKHKAADQFNKVAGQAEDMLSRVTEQGARPPSEWARSPATSRVRSRHLSYSASGDPE